MIFLPEAEYASDRNITVKPMMVPLFRGSVKCKMEEYLQKRTNLSNLAAIIDVNILKMLHNGLGNFENNLRILLIVQIIDEFYF